MNGLKRKQHYEEVLNAAVKNEHSQHGILSVGLQNFATKAINNPLFQRIHEGITGNMGNEQRALLDQHSFEHNMTRLSVDAKIPKEDLKWLVENLQQPPPPPQQPPAQNNNEARADFERMAAEIDKLRQESAVRDSHRKLAEENDRRMSAAAMATPAQQIIREHHYHVNQPIYIPTPAIPTTISEQSRHTGHSVHEIFIRNEPIQRKPPDEIPIEYFAGQPPSQPPKDGNKVSKNIWAS